MKGKGKETAIGTRRKKNVNDQDQRAENVAADGNQGVGAKTGTVTGTDGADVPAHVVPIAAAADVHDPVVAIETEIGTEIVIVIVTVANVRIRKNRPPKMALNRSGKRTRHRSLKRRKKRVM